jgi:hypothetical protein
MSVNINCMTIIVDSMMIVVTVKNYLHNHHYHIACRVLGLMTSFGPLRVKKSLEGLSLALFPTWLIFHNSMWQSVHLLNMLYPFILIILNFLYTWVDFQV